jgi:hypothetical protein
LKLTVKLWNLENIIEVDHEFECEEPRFSLFPKNLDPPLTIVAARNSFKHRFEQTTSSAHIFPKSKVYMGKYLKKSCLY